METSNKVDLTSLSGTELADAIRLATPEGAYLTELLAAESLARLVESDSRNHDLLAQGEMKWRGLVEMLVEAAEAFTDPAGNMPEDTGEFNELKSAMLRAKAALYV